MDNLTTEMIDRMSIDELADLPPNVLSDLQWLVADELVKARSRDNKLGQALEQRYGAQANAALVADGRDTGTIHLDDGQYDIAVTRPKRIEWDQDALRASLDAMAPDDARHYASVTVKVDERKFAAAPPAIQTALSSARTVKVGKPTFAISERKAA